MSASVAHLLRRLLGGRASRGLWLLVALFVALRLVQAAGGAFSYDDEDGFVAVAAWNLVHGVDLPYQAFVLSDWELGTALSVLICAPLTLLFGPSLMALKLTALLFSLVTLVALSLLSRRAFGRPAGLVTGALWALFPGPVLHYSLVAHGFHPESTAFCALFLLAVLAAVSSPNHGTRGQAWRSAIVGFLGGISISYAYISAMVVVPGGVAWAVWWARGRVPWAARARVGATALAGGVLGLSPWLLYNLDNGFAGLSVYGDRSLTSYISPTELGDKAAHFVEKTAPVLLHFDRWQADDLSRVPWFAGWFWAAAAVALALVLRRPSTTGEPGREPRPARLTATILACAAGLTLFVFWASRHPVYPWHLVPLLSLLMVLLGGAAARLWRSGGAARRLLAGALVLPAVLWGGAQNLVEVKPGQLGAALWIDGRNRPLFYDRMRDLSGRNPPLVELDNLEKWLRMPLEGAMAAPGKSGFHTSFFGQDLVLMLGGDRAVQRLSTYLAEPMHRQFGAKKWRLAGYVLGRLVHDGVLSAVEVRAFAAMWPKDKKINIFSGLGFALPKENLTEVLAALPKNGAQARALARGAGRGVRAFVLFDRQAPYCGRQLPALLRDAHMRGLGEGMACRLVTDDPQVVGRRVCPEHRAAAMRAFSAARVRCQGPDTAARRPPPMAHRSP